MHGSGAFASIRQRMDRSQFVPAKGSATQQSFTLFRFFFVLKKRRQNTERKIPNEKFEKKKKITCTDYMDGNERDRVMLEHRKYTRK